MSASTSTSAMVNISAVICTRNRPDVIGQAVASVLANDYPAFDLTIIDQSTSDSTHEALQPYLDDERVRYVRVSEAGLSRAYNLAIKQSSGQLLAFTDDDCVAPAGWLASVAQAFADDETVGLLYGQVLAPPDVSSQAGITPILPIQTLQRLSRHDGFKVFGMGANFAARRRLFDRIGLFDEVLGGGAPLRSSQDFDLAYRTYCAGSTILLHPDVKVIHYGTRTMAEWPATMRAYGIGDGAFYSKHVRCGDLYALRLLVTRLFGQMWRPLVNCILRRPAGDFTYVRFMVKGIRQGLQFGVDRRLRLYVQR